MLTEKPRIPFKEVLLVGILPSPIKKFIYRLKGHTIGKGVSIGFGAVVSGRKVSIGDYTQIGFFTIIRGNSIKLGAHVKVGATTFIDTPTIEIGDGTKINEQVFIGGLQFPDSTIKIGRNCQIMQMSFINPTRNITIGDDTGIGGHSLLFGHTSWLSCFEGYPVEFDSIQIGNSVSIAWRVFVLPGTRIGDGAVIGANSLVYRTIPPRCMAVGFPARIVSKEPNFPKQIEPLEKSKMLREIVDEFIDYLKGFNISVEQLSKNAYQAISIKKKLFKSEEKRWSLQIVYSADELSGADPSNNLSVLLSLPSLSVDLRKRLQKTGTMWIDIESKERSDNGNDFGEEVAQYLKRYGVRLFRVK